MDKRATWELHAFFEKIAEMPNVSLSYLWDPRLNPPPNKLKAHGMAVRWKIAREASVYPIKKLLFSKVKMYLKIGTTS